MTTLVGEPRRHLALRARVSVTFALISLLLTGLLAATTYFLARTYMLDQRERSATRQVFLNARLVKSELTRDEAADVGQALEQLQGELNSTSLIFVDQRWYLSSARVQPESIPVDLADRVRDGGAGRRRVSVSGDPYIVVGTPITEGEAGYYEFVPLENLERQLRILASSLAVASGITAIAGAAVGFYASRRLLRPLERVSAAAVDIAGGRLDTRLDDEGDADLEPIVRSFNEMAVSLQQRIEREARFASDVSHELRTPLTALSTAVQVVRARQADLPPRTRLAVDVLETQIRYFERLVLDLLEISRIDAGAAELSVEPVDVVELVRSVLAGYDGVELDVAPDLDPVVHLDRRRVERVLVNLLDNAEHHAGGATAVRIARTHDVNARTDDVIVLTVEDRGPGIPVADRDRIFDRFWRGPGARQQSVKGTGLGLALVAEHVRANGGSVRVDDNPLGGSRFVVELLAGEPT